MKLSMIIFLSLFLLSCGPSGYWTKPDFTPQQWERDRHECNYNAEVACYHKWWAPYKSHLFAVTCWNFNFKNCIQSRGYYWVQSP